MIDWSDANGFQLKLLQAAVLHAFPSPADLRQLLLLELDKNYVQIVSGGANYGTAVLDVLVAARGEGWLTGFVQVVARERPNNPRVRMLLRADGLTSAKPPPGRTIEDIVRADGGFQDLMIWLERMDRLAGRVCRIEYPINQGIGTGWLVGADLVLTNWHVIRKILSGERKASEHACRFDYARSSTGTAPGTVVALAEKWCEDSSQAGDLEMGAATDEPGPDRLDYSLLRLATAIGDQNGTDGTTRGWVTVRLGTVVPAPGTIMLVLQHESANPLKLSIGQSRGPNTTGTRLLHDANTLSGSSGSPCLNPSLDIVALHNSGDPLYDGQQPATNRSVPIDLILSQMKKNNAPHFWK